MPATRITKTEIGLHCSRCGLLDDQDDDSPRSRGYDHLLDKHRDELIAASSKPAVERTAP